MPETSGATDGVDREARLTLAQWRGWFLLVCHSPLAGFWALQLIVLVAGIVRVPSHPGEILAAVGALATINAMTRLVARSKGLEAWPPSPRELAPGREALTPPARDDERPIRIG